MARTMVRQGTQALDRAKSTAATLSVGVGAMWAVFLADLLAGGSLVAHGITPRSLDGLVGILFAPFLHASLGHLAVNTVSFVLLGALALVRGRRDFAVVSVVGALGSGLGAWLFGGAGTVHVGMSGVIFAYLGFLMARGWFERRPGAIALSVLVTWFFGSMAWGVLPLQVGVSWQAHLFGFLAGLVCAWRLPGAASR